MRKFVDFVKTSCNKVNEVSRKRMWYLPLSPRLQRLYASPSTTNNMRWHSENVQEECVLIKPYSCWSVIVTPYSMPHSMCMKEEYLFLTLIIPGPKNPKGKIDVF